MNILLIRNGVVENKTDAESVEAAQAFYPYFVCVENTGADIGWTYIDGVLAEPIPPVYVEPDPVAPTPESRVPITRLAFMRRFPTEKRIAIREAAKVDPVLGDAMSLLDLAQDVDLDDGDTQRLVGYLQTLGLISADDAALILG